MASLAYVFQERKELEDLGVCELKGILCGEVAVPGLASNAGPIDVLLDYAVPKFPGEDKLAEKENSTVRPPIVQVSTEKGEELIFKGR